MGETPSDWLLRRYDRGLTWRRGGTMRPMVQLLPDHECDQLPSCAANASEWGGAMWWTPDGPPPGRTP